MLLAHELQPGPEHPQSLLPVVQSQVDLIQPKQAHELQSGPEQRQSLLSMVQSQVDLIQPKLASGLRSGGRRKRAMMRGSADTKRSSTTASRILPPNERKSKTGSGRGPNLGPRCLRKPINKTTTFRLRRSGKYVSVELGLDCVESLLV
jgi:hypothetical protein